MRESEPDAIEAPAGLPAHERFLNRELSWLDFNMRVLAIAEDESLPLLERVKFLAIYGANLDEFFQVRVAGLRDQRDAGVGHSADGRTPSEQLAEIRQRTVASSERACDIWSKGLRPALRTAGIPVRDYGDLERAERARLASYYEKQIFPILTPLAVDPAHPFPYISNLSLNLAVLVQGDNGLSFARVKVPQTVPRFVPVPDGEGWVPVEQVIAAHLDTLFPGVDVISQHPFRVTRNAALDFKEDEAEDLLAAIESGLRRRSDAVRLELEAGSSRAIRDLLMNELELLEDDVYAASGLLDWPGLMSLCELARPDLKLEPWTPQPFVVRGDDDPDFFALLREGDLLVHHPYDSFTGSVQAFLEQAARDPDVLAIKHTLYRTSGAENSIVHTLTRAAETGKQVVTLVEVKARFEERRNIEWARKLEQSGVHVVYGLVGLKTHSKAALVVRREGDRIRRYCHVGTGNYNPTTARLYEDLGILSASEELGADLAELFNYLTGSSRQRHYRRILVAPETLRPRLLDLIREEAEAGDGDIALKVNNLSDPAIIDALYGASARGARVDLWVRGICCLRPGIPGLSEGIRVRSVLGRFLEHSRIFRFGSELRGRRYFMGSADLMTRKLDHRVELVVPVEDPDVTARVEEVLSLGLDPRTRVWTLGPDGKWAPPDASMDVDLQSALQQRALQRVAAASGEAELR